MPPTAVKITLIILLLISFSLHGQVGPDDGTRVCSRFIGFSVANMPMETQTLEIAKGIFADTTSFNQNIFTTVLLKNDKTTAKVPTFGTDYTWRIKEKKNLHYFSTLPCPYADTAKSRLRIVKGSQTDQDYYVLVDKTMCLYDMKGNIAWFLPGKCLSGTAGTIRDLKLTPQHTVTFIAGNQIREVDCDGNILWKGPNDGKVSHDTTEAYHHEFTRLVNGHYMVLGTEQIKVPLPQYHPPAELPGNISVGKDGKYYQSIPFGTVIEYDNAGKVIWSWHSSGYFLKSEMFSHYLPDGSYPVIDVHENAFWFNEKKSVLYVGFKNISRILKISYPDGKVIADYGNKNPDGSANHCSADFCGQHSIRLADNGDLLLFNNNCSTYTNLPQATIFGETNNMAFTKIWEYDCIADDINPSDITAFLERNKRMAGVFPPDKMMAVSMQQSAGGNFIDLPNDEYFVSTSGVLGKMFIINKLKEIIWSAVLEQRIFPDAPWTTSDTYRASIISKEDFEELISHTR